MPELLILRHAKSDWDTEYGEDHDRPLAARGVKDAKRIGRFVAASGQVPDLVLTSTARRARTTVELAVESGGWECRVEQVGALYGADPEQVVELLRGADLPERVMIVGHEPAWSELVSRLVGGGAVRMATGALACVGFDGAWSALAPGRGRLLWLLTPRLLGRVV
jgi:phosphohistidine phosphatase